MTKFNSHIKSLKIVLKPAMPTFEGGTKVSDVPGKYAQFVDGQFETQDEEIIAKLEALPTFNVDFWKASDESKQTKEPEVDGDLQKHTKKELQALAEEKGIELDGSETKDRLIELLQEKQEN
jgi:hypothetical protein